MKVEHKSLTKAAADAAVWTPWAVTAAALRNLSTCMTARPFQELTYSGKVSRCLLHGAMTVKHLLPSIDDEEHRRGAVRYGS